VRRFSATCHYPERKEDNRGAQEASHSGIAAYLAMHERFYEGLRKAGMPEECGVSRTHHPAPRLPVHGAH
jgi:hypothetical protein